MKLWHSMIDTYLAVKRWFYAIAGSGLWFETHYGALFVEVVHRGSRKRVRIATEKLDIAIRNIEKQPHGSAFVFKQSDHWVLIPDFLVPDLLNYLVTARDALARSRGNADVAPPAEPSKAPPTQAPDQKSVN